MINYFVLYRRSQFFASYTWLLQCRDNTVKTAVLLCEFNRHRTRFLRVLWQSHELMQRVLSKIRAQCGLIQHVFAALPMVYTSKRVFFSTETTPL